MDFFPRGVLDDILNLTESVSEEFPSYSFVLITAVAPICQYLCKMKLKYAWFKILDIGQEE